MGELMTDPLFEPQAEARAIARVWCSWTQHAVVCGLCVMDTSAEDEPPTPNVGAGCQIGVGFQRQMEALSRGIVSLQQVQTYRAGWS